jgi:hypothetical protein
MRHLTALAVAVILAAVVSVGVTGCCCPCLKKSESAAQVKCAKCGMDKAACKCTPAPAK